MNKWAQRNPTCPVCRSNMQPEIEAVSHENDELDANVHNEISNVNREYHPPNTNTNVITGNNDLFYDEDGFEFYSPENVIGYTYSDFDVESSERFSPDPEQQQLIENERDEEVMESSSSSESENSHEALHFLAARLHALGVEEEPSNYNEEDFESYYDMSDPEDDVEFVSNYYVPAASPSQSSSQSSSQQPQATCPSCWNKASYTCANGMCVRCCRRQCDRNCPLSL